MPERDDVDASSELKLVVDGCAAVTVAVADDWKSRARGLLFRPPLQRGEGLLLSPCSSVHTFLMREPIDVVYLGDDLSVVKTARVRPWRVSGCRRRARYTLELAAGEIERLGIAEGRRLSVHPTQELGG